MRALVILTTAAMPTPTAGTGIGENGKTDKAEEDMRTNDTADATLAHTTTMGMPTQTPRGAWPRMPEVDKNAMEDVAADASC